MNADVSNLQLVINSEKANLSLQFATPLSRLIIPLEGLLNNFRRLFTLSRNYSIPSSDNAFLSINNQNKNIWLDGLILK